MTFMDELRAGRASAEEIDEWVEARLLGPPGGPPMHVHLGMTWDEYHHWTVTRHVPPCDPWPAEGAS